MTPLQIDTTLPSPRLSCALTDIDVTDLLRKDLGDIDELVDSIKLNVEQGLPPLIHPIVLDSRMKLISGSRRLEAHRRAALTSIDYILIGVLDDATRVRLEVDANKQKVFDWRERVLGIDKYHRYYSTQSALKGESWGVRETGRLLRTGKTAINRATFIAGYLRAGDPQVTAAETMEDAYRVLARRREDELSAQLVKISSSKPNETKTEKPRAEKVEVSDGDFFAPAGTTGFIPAIAGPIDLDERPGDSSVETSSLVVVPLSKMFLHGDAVAVCKTFADGTFDAVITDWPYGIDMDMLNQGNDGHAFKDISTVEAEHTVSGNEALHAAIIPEIYRILKPNGWFITWTDVMQWQRNYDLAVKAGFKAQRWPLTWHKTSVCMNQSAQFNFTKNTEIAIACRKGNATLIRPQASTVWSGGSDAETKLLGHPFAKPAGLWEWLYNATCLRGAVVLDPFVGSGSSVMPAVRMGLRPMGIESNAVHYGTLTVNLQNFYRSLDPNCTFS